VTGLIKVNQQGRKALAVLCQLAPKYNSTKSWFLTAATVDTLVLLLAQGKSLGPTMSSKGISLPTADAGRLGMTRG
jgi:hypothetical protein